MYFRVHRKVHIRRFYMLLPGMTHIMPGNKLTEKYTATASPATFPQSLLTAWHGMARYDPEMLLCGNTLIADHTSYLSYQLFISNNTPRLGVIKIQLVNSYNTIGKFIKRTHINVNLRQFIPKES
jgi:hypothetical protein